MINPEWLYGYERLTPEQVKGMDAGSRVIVHGADRYGAHYTIEAQVVYCGKRKMLAYRDKMGNRLMMPIQKYAGRTGEGKAYTLPYGEEAKKA